MAFLIVKIYFFSLFDPEIYFRYTFDLRKFIFPYGLVMKYYFRAVFLDERCFSYSFNVFLLIFKIYNLTA